MRGKEAHVERCHAGPAVYVRGESPLLYCDAFDYWGKGTLVTVTTETQKAPTSLFGLSPCGSGGDAELLSLGCLASGYFPPGSVTFKWTDAAGNSVSDFLQYPSVKRGSTYSAVSQLQVKAEDWEGKNYKCTVEHPALSDSMTRTIQPPPEKSCLDVILKNPRAKDLFLHKNAVLECIVTGGNETDVTKAEITWTVNSEKKQGKEQQQSDPLRKSSFLSIDAKEWESGQSVECSVKPKNGPLLKKTIKAKTGNFRNPVISIFAPRNQDIDKNWLQLVCLVNVSDQSDIYVVWKKGQGPYEEGLTGEPVKTGRIHSVASIFTISKDDWNKGMMFSCAAAHSFLKSDESTISKSTSKSDVGQEEKYPELCVSEGILEVNESDSPWYTALSFIILFLFTFVYSAFVSLHQVKQ